MEVIIPITNKEDIQYIDKLSNNKISTLQTALSIGIKALSMTTIEMNGCSYYKPLEDCIKNSVGISVQVDVGKKGSVPRSQGKAIRVIDNR